MCFVLQYSEGQNPLRRELDVDKFQELFGCNTAKGQNPLRRPQRIFITLTGLKGCNTAKGQNPLRLNAWQDGRLRIEVVAIPRKGRTLCG